MPTSIWLLPPTGSLTSLLPAPQTSTRSSLVSIMAPVAERHLLPSADPHVTLIGDAGDLDAEQAAKLLNGLKGGGPVAIEFTALTSEAQWNQSGMALVKETAALVAIQRKALGIFCGADAAAKAPSWASPVCKPHLSLAYVRHTDASNPRTFGFSPPVCLKLALLTQRWSLPCSHACCSPKGPMIETRFCAGQRPERSQRVVFATALCCRLRSRMEVRASNP